MSYTPGQYKDLVPSFTGPARQSPIDWAGNFLTSSLQGMGELVGIPPSPTISKWRQDNPVSGFSSGLVGFGIPYVGWISAARKIKSLERAISTVGDLQKTPIMTSAARGALRMAPFEVGRVGVSQVVGDEPLDTMLGDAMLSLAIEGGVGGLIGGIASAGRRAKDLEALIPGLDINAPLQLQTRYIQKLLDEGTLQGDAASSAAYRLNEMRGLARGEQLPKGIRTVGEIDGVDEIASKGINRLFNLDKKGSLQTRLLSQGTHPQEFRKQADIDEFTEGLGPLFEDFVQFPRAITFRGDNALKTAAQVERNIENGLEPVGHNWYVGREADEGLFITAKKVKGKVGTADGTDKWLVFKTDDPSRFMPAQSRFAKFMIDKNKWLPGNVEKKIGAEVYDTTAELMKQMPVTNYASVAGDETIFNAALKKLMPQRARNESLEVVERVKDVVREYLTPSRLQFGKSPRANYVFNIARAAYDMAETKAQKMLYGVTTLKPGKNLFISMLKGHQVEDNALAIKTMIDGLSDKSVKEVWQIWREGMPVDKIAEGYAAGTISKEAVDFVGNIRKIDGDLWSEINATQEAVGERVAKAKFGHMLLSRDWEGTQKVILRSPAGKPVGVASAFNRAGAFKRAEVLKARLEEEGIPTKIGEAVDTADLTTLPKDLHPVLIRPGFVLERQGMRGFKWDLEPFTKDELMEGLADNVYKRHKYMANMTTTDLLGRDLSKLGTESPQMYNLVTQRLNDLAGVQSDFGKLQNKWADKVLSPMLGGNSATAIVRASNNLMFHYQFALKPSYAIMNSLQFVQTVAPEVSYIYSAAPGRLAHTYSYFAGGGTKGVVGAFGKLNPWKVIYRSFKEMAHPDKNLNDAFEWATQNRVIAPRLVEEFVGEQSTSVMNLKAAISSPGGFVKWLTALSEWMPANSERFARTQAFASGYIVGRDYLKLQGEELLRFSKQFTENTSFLYSTADRPRMFTTPAGSAFGLFKNWLTNYIFAMAEYSGQAAKGNWGPILWQTAGTLGIGGVAATPLAMVANGFNNMFSDNSLLENTYEQFGEFGGDAINFGLPAALTGASLYGQAATPLANPSRDAKMLFSIAHLDRTQYFGRAMGQAWDHWQATGESPTRDPRTLELLTRALAPATLYKIIGATQEEGIRSLSSGLPLTLEATPAQKVLYSLGFTPVEMERGLAIAEQIYQKKAAEIAEVKRLGQAFADAQQNKDSRRMGLIIRQAAISGLDPSRVLQSAMTRIDNQNEAVWERAGKWQTFRSLINGN